MTLEELYERANKNGFKYSYGVFLQDVKPPHLIAKRTDSNNFIADNKVYKKIEGIELQLTTEKINLELEEKIEDKILYDVCWNKTEETYISNEKVWNVSYFFEI